MTSSRKTTKAIGNAAESRARDYLEQQNLQILEQNYRLRGGEIDIIAKDGKTIVFVEVKYRKNNTFGEPYEAVGQAKQRKLVQTAQHYLLTHDKQLKNDYDYRFDVISICNFQVTWLKNAFDAFSE